MSGTCPYLDVQWIPNLPDHLLTWSTDIKLYRVSPKSVADYSDKFPPPGHGFRISSNHVAEPEHSLPEPPHYIKCVALHPMGSKLNPEYEGDIRLAVGQANGRISLLTFAGDRDSQLLKEFSPRSLRACTGLAWNVADHRLLAAGFEKTCKSDAGILVFDTEKSAVMSTVTTSNTSRFSLSATKEEKFEYVRATTEMALGETCNSLTWWRQQQQQQSDNGSSGDVSGGDAHCIVAGMGNKNLKIFDARTEQVSKASACTFTRAVYGVCVDPFLDFRVASHQENQVVIWDTRNFEKPIVTLSQKHKVTQIKWSPNRAGLLCSAEENSLSLTIHDIQSWSFLSEDGEPSVTERSVDGYWKDNNSKSSHPSLGEHSEQQQFNGFAWHPQDEARIVAVTNNGVLSEVVVTERLAPSWSNEHCIAWPKGGVLRFVNHEFISTVRDVSVVMQERARSGYGNEKCVGDNAKHVEEDSVADAWNWLHLCGKLMADDPVFRSQFPAKCTYPGVRGALGLNGKGAGIRSESASLNWKSSNFRPKRVFKSEGRTRAQKICGWSSDPKDLEAFIKRCEEKNEFSRAAAVAIFCLDIKSALDVLRRGAVASSSAAAATLNMTTISLSGYSEDGSSMWREMVTSNLKNIEDPYLKAMFSFLIDSDAFDCIVENDDSSRLLIADKIAFACQYLPDDRLTKMLKNMWTHMLKQGELTGLLLCGMEEETIDLLQKYLDLTGDVQTCCWLSVRCQQPILGLREKPQLWYASYRDMLDSWQLWIERCDFDIAVNAAAMTKIKPQQVFISCNYCGSNIQQQLKPPSKDQQQQQENGGGSSRNSSSGNRLNRQGSSSGGSKKNNVRSMSCGNCRKPLPRCAVCLITMGSNASSGAPPTVPDVNAPKVNNFNSFFTWCQTCRHGGHAGHLMDWFKEQPECPVSGCVCRCSALDPEMLGANPFRRVEAAAAAPSGLRDFMGPPTAAATAAATAESEEKNAACQTGYYYCEESQ